ncbi:UNVERIFIED_CONTAM: hypothetical protein K2H54_054720 [Gekko kuhli]
MSPKMAADNNTEDGGAAFSHTEFFTTMEELKASIQLTIADQIKQAVQQAIQPLSDDLKAITTTLSEVAQAAETALETAMTTQEEVQQLQRTEDWTRSKIMSMDNKLREKNLKFRNLPEDVEQESDLKTCLASWISKTLKLEEGVQPLIDKAHRLVPTQRKKDKFPRDETLQHRKALKPVLQKLLDNNIRFKWASPTEILVIHQNQRYSADDLPSG